MEDSSSQTKKPIWKRWWFWVGVVIVFFIIVGSLGNNDTKTASTSASIDQPPVQAIKVSAETLMRDYTANEVAADAKYKDKLIEVSGVISSIGKDILNKPYVALQTSDVIFTVQCMFDPSASSKLVNLTKDKSITVTGTMSGKMGNVILKQCGF